MDTEQQVIYVLLALVIGQQIWFHITLHRLINKVMSRNYTAYVQARQLEKDKPAPSGIGGNLEAEEDWIHYQDEVSARAM